MTAKITATTTATWSFSPTTMTVNGRTFGASYSVARGGDVYVFTGVQAPDAQRIPVRMHITQDMPMYADALAAARLAAEAEAAKAKPAPVEAPKVQAPAPVQEAPKEQAPAPVQDAPKPAKAPKAAKPKAKPAPVQDAAQAVCKAWIGSTITGKGWRIVFDGDAQRTRVIFDAKPTAAQAAAVDAARFYYSPSMGSYNKHLTCKAYKAAQALAQTLAGLAA